MVITKKDIKLPLIYVCPSGEVTGAQANCRSFRVIFAAAIAFSISNKASVAT
jgi:hypothetical protein